MANRTDVLDPRVEAELAALIFDPQRPLVIVDADEVLFAHMEALEPFLAQHQLRFTWRAYILDGEILDQEDKPIPAESLWPLMGQFYETCIADFPAVEGAPEALSRLSQRAQILILTNIYQEYREGRLEALARQNMTYPMVCNMGNKGPALAYLAKKWPMPMVFLDDIHHHLEGASIHAVDIHRIHFIGDKRLSPLAGKSPAAHAHFDDWPRAIAYLENWLDQVS